MNNIPGCLIFALLILVFGCTNDNNSINEQPNIVIIYADDLGYGDVSCYESGTLKTPNIDRLAEQGIRFTNGYCTSATCTPSRFGLLTGKYPWRNQNARILPGDAPLLITPGSLTIPSLFKSQGYKTGIVGKWHLGLGSGNVNWNAAVKPGPRSVGFDYSFIMAATNDRVPTVYVENEHVLNLDPNDPIKVNYKENFDGEPTGIKNPEMLKMMWSHGHNNSIVNGIGRIGFMKGGRSAHWIDENMADTFLVRAQNFVQEHKNEPFFLYYALHQPHVPRVPNPRFKEISGMGPRGDAIIEADWCVGEMIKLLESEGLIDNTIVIFTSDNGPVLDDGYKDESIEKIGDHTPAGMLRGGKYSLYDGATRVPFILQWKGKVKPAVSDALVCQIDFLASFAKLLNADLDKNTDSENLLPAFLGKTNQGRQDLVVEAMRKLAYRNENWVLIPPYEGEKVYETVNIETGKSSDYQLYNLENDIQQKTNLANTNPAKLNELKQKFEQIINTN